MRKQRPDDGILRLSPKQFISLRTAIEDANSKSVTREGAAMFEAAAVRQWLDENGWDASSFSLLETQVEVDGSVETCRSIS